MDVPFGGVRRLLGPVLPYARNVNQRYHSRNRRRSYNPRGVDVFQEDWDALVILDGCRYDTFEAYNTLPGRLGWRESRGAMTVEFLEGNLSGRVLHDTVYVTANGQFFNYSDDLDADFHHVENVWHHADAWSDEHHTVPPAATTAYARRAAERFPNKRLLVHYVQPHYPFLDAPIEIDDAFDPETPDFWRRVLVGNLAYDTETLTRAYERNLELALPHVGDLVESLDGKTVVTSDHGNMLGERAFPVPMREWGHPASLWIQPLTRVPWLVSVTYPRPEITSEPPPSEPVDLGPGEAGDGDEEPGEVDEGADGAQPGDDEDATDRVTDHLRALGYRE